MKAKEYVAKALELPTSGDRYSYIVHELHDRLQQLCKSRNIKTFRDSLSAWDEINNLWKAIARQLDFEEKLFEDVMIAVYPEMGYAIKNRRTKLE